MENKNIYEQLFDITNQNMQQAGNVFVHSKTAFLCYAQTDPHAVDLIDLAKRPTSNVDFLEIAYIEILNRPVDEEGYRNWKKKFDLPEQKFRAQLIRCLTASPEANLRHKRVYNNIFARQKRKRQKNVSMNFMVQKMLPLYHRLPEGVKLPIRKIMGVKEG